MHAFPVNLRDGAITTSQGSIKRVPARRNAEHAAPGSEPFIIWPARSCCMKNCHRLALPRGVEAVDLRAGFGLGGITARGKDDAGGSLWRPIDWHFAEALLSDGLKD